MEKYDVEGHLFFDGYKLDNRLLSDPKFVQELLEAINKYIEDREEEE